MCTTLPYENFRSAASHCTACPRKCSALREKSAGLCRESGTLRLAWAGLHFGEEPPITGSGGSGAIFLTGCNLHCLFCQNYQISQEGMGRAVSEDEFVEICLALQKLGAENINIITGSHASREIIQGLRLAKNSGLKLPVCWNSSAYETEEGLEALDEVVDIWLPDMKTLDSSFSARFFSAPDYPEVAARAVERMASLAEFRVDTESGKMLSGVLVRHLAMPGRLDDSRSVLEWFDARLRGKAELSFMTQYTPIAARPALIDCKEGGEMFESRFISESEYKELQAMLEEYRYPGGYFQELSTDDSWLPDFSREQPFSDALARTVWHWTSGFAAVS